VVIALLVFGHLGVAVGFALHILLRRKEPASMMAWILAVVLLPLIGPLTYVVFGEARIRRKAHRRRRKIDAHLSNRFDDAREAGPVEQTSPENALIAQTATATCGLPPSGGNRVAVLADAERIYGALADAIQGATQFVHLQYFIWRDDKIGTRLRDLLIERARAGVEVRLLLDSFGSRKLARTFLPPLEDAGGRVAWFLTTMPIKRRWSLHLRNHRKLVIVDGTRAFVGSQNVGDEYLGRGPDVAAWYDCQLEISGPVLEHLQVTFAEDWAFASDERLTDERYYTASGETGKDRVQILATGPDTETRQVESVLFDAFVNASESITIVTPYFVPSDVIVESLRCACRKGVRVRIVHPRETDRAITLWAARSFYDKLLAAGVEMFELPRGMLHSKIVIVDDRWACVGSTNMDIRSFRLNFELSTLLFDSAAIAPLHQLCDDYFDRAEAIDPGQWSQRKTSVKLREGAARLAAPLL
jgi:cardiolipin synthase